MNDMLETVTTRHYSTTSSRLAKRKSRAYEGGGRHMPWADRISYCYLLRAQILVSCTKGILNDTLETVNQILTRVLPPALHERLAFLSGPSFAAEVPCCAASPCQTPFCYSNRVLDPTPDRQHYSASAHVYHGVC